MRLSQTGALPPALCLAAMRVNPLGEVGVTLVNRQLPHFKLSPIVQGSFCRTRVALLITSINP